VGDGDGLTDGGPFRLSLLASANRLLTCEIRVARNPGNPLHAAGYRLVAWLYFKILVRLMSLSTSVIDFSLIFHFGD
jgi:hypothetical protein